MVHFNKKSDPDGKENITENKDLNNKEESPSEKSSPDANSREETGGKKKKKRKKHEKGHTSRVVFNVLFVCFTFLAVLVILSAVWAFTSWSNLEMSEIIFQLTSPLTGTGNNMIENYILRAPVPAIIAAAVVAVVLFFFRKENYQKRIAICGFVVALAATVVTAVYAGGKLHFMSWLVNRNKSSTYIEDNYADPAKVKMTFPEKKRNLIYIFLESMEKTYTDKKDGGGFKQDVIPELTKLAQQNEMFAGKSKKLNGGYSLTGTTWTMGAMFGQTSGLPLIIPLDTNGMSTQTVFFPGITTLGDILENQGYNQVLMLGSNATFGGRRLYFTQHGNYSIMDYSYAMQQGWIPQGYRVWWGYEDEKLFANAKNELTQLGNGSEPFNFTMLTVDTHFPDGYVCDLCDDEFGDNQYANVMHCSSRQVVNFVNWCKQQPWYDNTTIVISGDHPTMDADFCNDVDKDYTRKVYTTYINSAVKPKSKKRRTYSTLDDFPTTLASLGVKIKGNRLGLGTNLFSNTKTLSERDGYHKENSEFQRHSAFMQKASAISTTVVKERQKIENTKCSVKVYVDKGNYVQFDVTGVDKFDDLSTFRYAFMHCRNSKQLTLTEPILKKREDGSYAIRVPWYKFQGYKNITYMLRIRTTSGTVDMTDAIPVKIS